MVSGVRIRIIDRLAQIYHSTAGRFINCASLYRLDLSIYEKKPCSINREHYDFLVLPYYVEDLEEHLIGVKGKLEIVKKRFSTDNYICLAYRHKETKKVAYTRWICKKSFFSDDLKQQLKFNDEELLTLDSFTKPEYRGMKLHRDMNIDMLNWLKSETDYRYVYMIIKCFIPHLTKYPLILGYRRTRTRVFYKKGSLAVFCKYFLMKLKHKQI